MNKNAFTAGAFLTLLAVVFSLGLTFASIELPDLLHKSLVGAVPSLDGDSHGDDAAISRTELFMDHYHFRTIGYACFGLMVLLIIGGFVTGKRGLASAGALLMFLPVFAQFAAVMFFLAGLGILNLIWLPVLDISFSAGRLGEIVYLPYRWTRWLFARIGVDVHYPLVYFLIGAGLLLFTLGTLAWFLARQRKKEMADFWVYRFSRHPQYLGWIVWSYGMLLSLMRVRYPKRSWGISTALSWLLSAMVIIGVSLLEEVKMKGFLGEAYDRYRRKTPFFFPLPKFIAGVFTLPSRLLFRKPLPERKGEIAAVLLFYTCLLMGLSHLYILDRSLPKIPENVTTAEGANQAEKYAEALKSIDNWHGRIPYVTALEKIGRPAVEPLLTLLKDPDPTLRQIAAASLGRIGSPEAVESLIDRLSDTDPNVRWRASSALGLIGDQSAVIPLIAVLQDETEFTRGAAALALGKLGSLEAVEPLISALKNSGPRTLTGIISALGDLGSERAVDPLVAILDEGKPDVYVRREIMVAFGKIGSDKVVEVLRKACGDDDPEVRLYASESLKKIRRRDRSRSGSH